MSNVESLLNGQAETLDLQVMASGAAALKAAGESLGIPPDNSDPRAPQLVQLAFADFLSGPPTSLTLVQGTGTLGAGTYYYRVSAITPAGETIPCAEGSVTIGATTGVVLSWLPVQGATGYRVYGRSTGAELFIAEVTAPTLTYTDSGSITPTGAMPTTNTARFVFATDPVKAATATLANVAGSASSVTLLAANAKRKGATIVNDSSALLYIKCAASAASTTSYTIVLGGAASAPFSYWECPYGYTGEIRGIWGSATGNARVTEFV